MTTVNFLLSVGTNFVSGIQWLRASAVADSLSVVIDQNKKLPQSCHSWVKVVNLPRAAAGK